MVVLALRVVAAGVACDFFGIADAHDLAVDGEDRRRSARAAFGDRAIGGD